MREILFRGKCKYNGEWIEGFYCPTPFSRFPRKPVIYAVDTINLCRAGVEIDPETIGQFIGLHDKNGRKIFEGDIVEFSYLNLCSDNKETNRGEVIYSSEIGAYTIEGDYLLGELFELEVIGNIHDNPELLEVEK